MQSKLTLLYTVLIIVITLLTACSQKNIEKETSQKNRLAPSSIDGHYDSENPENSVTKEDYFELVHKCAPGTNWRALEQKNIKDLYSKRISNVKDNALPFDGEWIEKGTKNQPGDLKVTFYYAPENKIYAISTSGTLWSANLDGTEWTPLSDDIVLQNYSLSVVETANGGKNIVCAFGKNIHTSKDNGKTWFKSFGMNLPYDPFPPRRLITVDDEFKSMYFLVYTGNATLGVNTYNLYYSKDKGINWALLDQYNGAGYNEVDIWSAVDSDELYLVDNNGTEVTTYKYNGNQRELLGSGAFRGNQEIILSGTNASGSMVLYANAGDYMFQTKDLGKTWEELGPEPPAQMPGEFMADPWVEDRLYWGGVIIKSTDDNCQTWKDEIEIGVKYWYEDTKYLFVDIMYLNPFYTANGTPFILLSHHSGLHVTYDNLATTEFWQNKD